MIQQDFKRELYKLDDVLMRFFGLEEASIGQQMALVELKKSLARDKIMLAGGALLSIIMRGKVNDLDFYMYDIDGRPGFEALLVTHGYKISLSSTNAITYQRTTKTNGRSKKFTIQLITRFKGTPDEVLSTFDFTVTKVLYSFYEEEFYFGDRFWLDLAARRLVYSGCSSFPLCALHRLNKYSKKGFTIPNSTKLHIALSILQLEIKTYAQLKEQLFGIDTILLQGMFEHEDNFRDELPVDYGKFIEAAFERLDPNGKSYVEEEIDDDEHDK